MVANDTAVVPFRKRRQPFWGAAKNTNPILTSNLEVNLAHTPGTTDESSDLLVACPGRTVRTSSMKTRTQSEEHGQARVGIHHHHLTTLERLGGTLYQGIRNYGAYPLFV